MQLLKQSKNRFEGQMKEILRKRAKEKRDAEIIMAIQAKKIQNLTKTNYFKPN